MTQVLVRLGDGRAKVRLPRDQLSSQGRRYWLRVGVLSLAGLGQVPVIGQVLMDVFVGFVARSQHLVLLSLRFHDRHGSYRVTTWRHLVFQQ